MQPDEPYNEIVRQHFANPAYAGDLQGEYALTYVAEVAASEQGVRIVLTAGIQAGRIAEMRFRAWGCPHLIAATNWVCAARQSASVEALAIFEQNEIMRRLSIPEAKIGRILLLEDALASLAKQHANRAKT